MSAARCFTIGAASSLAFELVVALAAGFVGIVPIGADRTPGALETLLATRVLRAAVARAANAAARPQATADPAGGADIYAAMCERCHGGAAKPGDLGGAFYPPAPTLAALGSHYNEREIAWIVAHGIRNTGMPAWRGLLSDDDIGDVAAFVKHFDRRH